MQLTFSIWYHYFFLPHFFLNFTPLLAASENRTKAGAAGGIEVIVKTINTHIDNAVICEQGCGALWNMTINGKNTQTKQSTTNKMPR